MAKTLKEIEQELEQAELVNIESVCSFYESDERASVQKLLAKYRGRKEKLLKEFDRVRGMTSYEMHYPKGTVICGIDEAGRGPLAGPVVAGAVILPDLSGDLADFLYINDSKQLSEKKREELFEVIKEHAVSYGVGIVSPERIDEINILQADYEAMRIAVSQLTPAPEILLNDAVIIPGLHQEQVSIIKGDAKSLSIAAASIMAKVTRDDIMKKYDIMYPEYGFASHKGYGSRDHIEVIKKYGPCPIHRRSFLKNILGEGEEQD